MQSTWLSYFLIYFNTKKVIKKEGFSLVKEIETNLKTDFFIKQIKIGKILNWDNNNSLTLFLGSLIKSDVAIIPSMY